MESEIKQLADLIRNTAYQIHLDFPPGYLEKVYENLLAHRLAKAGIEVEQQHPIAVCDNDGFVAGEYVADLIVDGKIIVELKAVSALTTIHEMQLINYLRATGMRHGMLINFGSDKFQCVKRAL
jgi:GxxExxY protein